MLRLGARFNLRLFSSLSSPALPSGYASVFPVLRRTMDRRSVNTNNITVRTFSSWLSSPPKPPPQEYEQYGTSDKIEVLKEKVQSQDVCRRDVLHDLDNILEERKRHDSDSRADLLQARLDESRREKDKLNSGYVNRGSRLIWMVIAGVAVYFLWGRITKDEGMFKDNFQEIHPPGFEESGRIKHKQQLERLDVSVNNIVTFDDVKGNDDAKEELRDLVDYLQNPDKYQVMGLDLPKGVLLDGPPGTGKTLLARALAGEAGVPFIAANGSSFVQIFAGLGAQRVRKLFARARDIAPCIVFIDEIDAIGSRRDTPQNYSKQTLNQLLGEMDGFAVNSGVIVVGATNLANSLDPALVRPGRFDRKVKIVVPDRKVRQEILALYLKDNGSDDIDLALLAAGTSGMTGSDLRQIVNRAGIETVKKKMEKITMAALIDAQETLMMGRSNTDMRMSEETLRTVAYHEAGHALVALYTPASPPIYKATVLPRGGALGFVAYTPKDEHLKAKESYLAQMDVCMGGRAAEEIILGDDKVTQGASSDFQQASVIARNMVTKLGMSESVGKVYYSDRTLTDLSSHERQLIDNEVRGLLDASFVRAKTLLIEHTDQHHLLAQTLLKEETLSIQQIKKLVEFNE